MSVTLRALTLTTACALFAGLPATAAPGRGAPIPVPRGDEDEAADEGEEEDRWLAVVGGDVYAGLGGALRGATVLAKNGVIEEIGYDLWIPDEAEVLDAGGLRVYPGLVAISASSRIPEGTNPFFDPVEGDHVHGPGHGFGAEPLGDGPLGPLGAPGEALDETLDDEEGSKRQTYDADLADSFDPFGYQLVLALSAGITTVGQSKVTFKLKRGELEGVILRDKYLDLLSWSLNNATNITDWYEKFERAAEYLRAHRAWEDRDKEDKDQPEPSRKGVDTTALSVLRGDVRARFNLHDRAEILGAARLAQRFGFRPVFFGCGEGWTVADELGRAGAAAVLTPRSREEKDEQLVRPGGTSIENAAILHRAGVQVAVIPSDTSINLGGTAGRDLLHLPIEAAFAVRGGLPEQAALHAITIVPARLLGVDHRVGTLEVGKDCDLIVTDGDLLHYETFVQYTVVDGKIVYDKDEELFFAHIRPRPETSPEEPAQEPAETPAEPEAEGAAAEGPRDGDGEDGDREGGDGAQR